MPSGGVHPVRTEGYRVALREGWFGLMLAYPVDTHTH
jgi:hypothetical protein